MSFQEVFVSRLCSELWVKAVRAEWASKYNMMLTGLQSFLSACSRTAQYLARSMCLADAAERDPEAIKPGGGATWRSDPPHPTLVTHFIHKHMKEYSGCTQRGKRREWVASLQCDGGRVTPRAVSSPTEVILAKTSSASNCSSSHLNVPKRSYLLYWFGCLRLLRVHSLGEATKHTHSYQHIK